MPWFHHARDPSDVAWLRRFAGQLERPPGRERPATVTVIAVAAVLQALRGLRNIWLTMRAQSPLVRRRHGVGYRRQFGQLLWAAFRYNFSAGQYFKLRLHALDEARWRQVLDHRETTLLLTEVARRAGRDALWTKRGWEAFGTRHHLPVVKAVTTVFPGAPITAAQLAALRPGQDYYGKPDISYSSKGGCLLTWVPAQGLWTVAGGSRPAVTLAGLADFLDAQAGLTPHHLVIQPRLRNHPALAALSPESLANARVTTVRDPTGRIHVIQASLRFSVVAHHASDCPGWTICAPIDPETGLLGRNTATGLHLDACAVHPRFGMPIAGRTMVQWAEIKALVLRAHALIPPMPVIAWDAIPQAEGPLLLEANAVGGGYLLQQHGELPVGETLWPRAVRQWLEQSQRAG